MQTPRSASRAGEGLPRAHRSTIRHKSISAAPGTSDITCVERRSNPGWSQTAEQLEGDHPGAAGSIREGLDETLTLIALGVSGWLHRTLISTNPIENIQGTLQRVSRNVKRWRGGAMTVRWVVAASEKLLKRTA